MQLAAQPRFVAVATRHVGRRGNVVVAQAAATATAPRTAARTKPALINGVIFRQLYDEPSSTYSYLIGDPETYEAVLIDPVLEQVERDLEVIDGLGLQLVVAANTHAHADHVTGSGKLKALRPGMRSAIAAASGAAGDIQLEDGEALPFGSLALRCLSTPGHTNGCMSFYLPGAPGMVFTGDALLIHGCGRTDFQQGNPGELYDNIHAKLFSLPEDTLVMPGHDYRGRTASSIGEERTLNPRLTKSREEFIELMRSLKLPHPRQIARSLPANKEDGVNWATYE